MRRRVLLCFVLAIASGCRGGDLARPILDPTSPPSRSISDGSHCVVPGPSCTKGNPDFFFLPPMASNPSSSPNWTAGAFNARLTPTVDICELDAMTEASVAAGASCKTDGYVRSFPLGAAEASASDEQYHVNWGVPNSAAIFFRIAVRVGSVKLGWADVETASTMSQLKNVNTGQYVPLTDGRTLPIKFRIENYALCAVPGVGPCGSAAVDLAQGGTVATTLVNTTLPSGIVIPPQTSSPGAPPVTITVEGCTTFNDRATDLPVFGPCVRVTSDPALSPAGFTSAATVFICDVSNLTVTQGVGGQVLDHDQADRITLHRLDPGAGGPVVTALPHAPACGGGVASALDGSFSGMLVAMRHGDVRTAARQVAAMMSPKPLYAARFIDLGGGGLTAELSDFQFALPTKMVIDPATDGQTVDAGSMLPLLPTVRLTDLGGAAVRGARVHFMTSDGSVTTLTAVTGEDGIAQTNWTLGYSANNLLSASGRGLAGTDVNGPRRSAGSEFDDIVDPFQPIQSHFDGAAPPSGPVLVLTGSVTFSASAVVSADMVVFNDLDIFDDEALLDANNHVLLRNLVNFSGAAARASGTTVVMEGGHGSSVPSCMGPNAQAEIRSQGYTFTSLASSVIGAQPADVKALVLCVPAITYTDQEISAMKQFAAEGGRLIFVGEFAGFYGAGGLAVENQFLTDMGAQLRTVGGAVDCSFNVLPAASLRPHQITTGMTDVKMACSSAVTLGEHDAALWYDHTNTQVLSAVAKVDVTPRPAARLRAMASPPDSSATRWVPTLDPAGRPIP